jgi:hypothetical protein
MTHLSSCYPYSISYSANKMFCILPAWVGKLEKSEERKHSSLMDLIHKKAFIGNTKGGD